jgi:hypothetical protein
MRRHPARFAILAGGGIAGAFDITYAIVYSAVRGMAPQRLLQSVASGLLGTAAYEGGARTAALGLALHFSIALAWASGFYLASRRLPALVRHAVAAGLAYGVVIYLVMYLVVLRYSAFPTPVTFTPFRVAINLAAHMFLIGLPMALATRAAGAAAP